MLYILSANQVLRGLIMYRDTLKKMINKHPQGQLYQMLDMFAGQAGFKQGSVLYNDAVAERIEWHKQIIDQNYNDARDLVVLLDQLIMNFQDNNNQDELHYGC